MRFVTEQPASSSFLLSVGPRLLLHILAVLVELSIVSRQLFTPTGLVFFASTLCTNGGQRRRRDAFSGGCLDVDRSIFILLILFVLFLFLIIFLTLSILEGILSLANWVLR